MPILYSAARINPITSDVGLPGMSGRQLAEVARSVGLDPPSIFVTSYAENAAIRAGFFDTSVAMMKPFSLDDFAAKIGEMKVRQAFTRSPMRWSA